MELLSEIPPNPCPPWCVSTIKALGMCFLDAPQGTALKVLGIGIRSITVFQKTNAHLYQPHISLILIMTQKQKDISVYHK